MKRSLMLPALAAVAMAASAQQIIEQPTCADNWQIGINGGVTTPFTGYPFFKSMKGAFGLNLGKQLTPVVGVGAEGEAYINTSKWGFPQSSTMIDASYVGAYGTVDLVNLFGGYSCEKRPFTLAAVAGAGWLHAYYPEDVAPDQNDLAAKVGLNFNFNVSDNVALVLQPSIMWNLTASPVKSVSFDSHAATFNLTAGVAFNLGGNGFKCVQLDRSEIDALNGQVNALRADLQDAAAANAALAATAADLNAQLIACQNQPPQVIENTQITEVNYLNSVRYVFFKIGSSVITNDQMPNVEMIAAFLKNHPNASVVINGYASKDGPEEVNIKLAQARAQSVKDALVNKYGIQASRIQAQGKGIGEMFEEESWNRVSICTIQNQE